MKTTHTPINLLEVYVNYFIGMYNNLSLKNLRSLSRAMLHSIHVIFPPPAVTGHSRFYQMAVKKLKDGDRVWAFKKEVLGWNFNGLKGTIQLPNKKCEKIYTLIRKVLRNNKVSLNSFQKLAGKLQHASLGIMGG